MKNYFIGIDFAKKKIDVAALRADGLSEKGVYAQFENSVSGARKLERWLGDVCGTSARDSALICGENTGVYSVAVSKALARDGYTVCIESPLRIKRSLGLTRGKTDRKDARDIAEYAARHRDRLTPYAEPDKEIEALKTLFTHRRLLVAQRCDLQRRNREMASLYKGNPMLEGMLGASNRVIKALDREVRNIEGQMARIIRDSPGLSRTYAILTSMKGVAMVNAVALIAHTDNFRRFDFDARRICSYWGIAPFANQSGSALNGTPHVSHLADRYLKSLLSQAVVCAIRFCPEIKQYAQRLKDRGKHLSVIRNNCKNKMIHILVAMVKNGTFYGQNNLIANEHENNSDFSCI